MARSIAARRHGDDFQARLFWLRAALLLDPRSNVIKVAYETGPKSFDDILVEYDPKAAPQDHEGRPILRRHSQCKWHTTAGVFGHADLIDPAFTNAERYSLLQRAHLAQAQHAPDGTGCRFELVTNWRIKADDPLLELVRKESDELDLARLFEGKTERGRMGQVRKLWCEHLGVDHAGLALVARTLAVAEAPESLASLQERLDDRFASVGMKRVPTSEAGFFYDDLAAKLLAQGRVEFDRDGFRKMAERENLIDPAARPADALAIGIRSFMHPIDPIEDRCAQVLNLVPYFDRAIHPQRRGLAGACISCACRVRARCRPRTGTFAPDYRRPRIARLRDRSASQCQIGQARRDRAALRRTPLLVDGRSACQSGLATI